MASESDAEEADDLLAGSAQSADIEIAELRARRPPHSESRLEDVPRSFDAVLRADAMTRSASERALGRAAESAVRGCCCLAGLARRRWRRGCLLLSALCLLSLVQSMWHPLFGLALPPRLASSVAEDPLTEGRSCQWAGGTGGYWVCRDCPVHDTGGACRRLWPRARCWPFSSDTWNTPPLRAAAVHDPGSSRAALKNVLRLGTAVAEQPRCNSLTSSPLCFDLRRCKAAMAAVAAAGGAAGGGAGGGADGAAEGETAGGAVPVFAYEAAAGLVQAAADALPGVVVRVHDPAQACLLVVESGGGLDAPSKLESKPSWLGGLNHLVWYPNYFFGSIPDVPLVGDGAFNWGSAALASPSHEDALTRVGFDMPVPLQSLLTWPTSRAERLASAAAGHGGRRWLVSFKGQLQPWPQVWWQHRYLAFAYWEDAPDVFVDVKCAPFKGYATSADREYFRQLLLQSTFVFAPGGGAPTSYRFAELLAAGAIPVVTADLMLPFHSEVDWAPCAVTVSEARIVDLPRLLRAVPNEEVERRRAACSRLFESVIGEKQLEDGSWGSDKGKTLFKTAMKVWHVRIVNALKVAQDLEDMLVHG